MLISDLTPFLPTVIPISRSPHASPLLCLPGELPYSLACTAPLGSIQSKGNLYAALNVHRFPLIGAGLELPLVRDRGDSRFIQSIAESPDYFETVDGSILPDDRLDQDEAFDLCFSRI